MSTRDVLKLAQQIINPRISYIQAKGKDIYELREYKRRNSPICYFVKAYDESIELLCTKGLLY